ncbi:tRNA uridine-5-carboxymethylaminomethyl(34) synthesis GTPase MnmE [Oceaniglobus indicus]|uniref:tRNA uridine-5-carboxymethylaminomethyl(34) synthesis GTPase MnmE n=1 Tax=Oceaniglobus indicus TaxID=2047749 RepID=UPI000C19ADC5|nr:tRNA uridine-5-carboxymethylaminomethyl(34) synthesis GTPase MnmE [Oceaniglobus indicus]
MDTIFALASARGKAGVAIVRVSGDSALMALDHFNVIPPKPRQAAVRNLSTADRGLVDQALILVFEDGHSFTGETVVEFQLHGSVAVVSVVLDELSKLPDFRVAEAGEFTRRALENDRLDLTQVEGLADLIEAETEAQRKQAQRVLSGKLGEKTNAWRRDLIRAAALLEATIDFADEDVPIDVKPEVLSLVDQVLTGLMAESRGFGAAERIREGFEVAIIGAPNVGKSTLLNALAGREAAITSEVAGTTRDVIEVRMDIGGYAVTLLDTAGLRETEDTVEALGIERARSRANLADIRVHLMETPEAVAAASATADDLVFLGRGDLFDADVESVSGRTLAGFDVLIERIRSRVEALSSSAGVAIRARHQQALEQGIESLKRAKDVIESDQDAVEFAAEDLRRVVRDLEALTGHVNVESLLDVIFSSFCVGK